MAWVQVRPTKSGQPRYRVYWRDPSQKVHGKTFARKRDAEAHGRLMEQWKAEGTYIDPNRGRITLSAFVEEEVLVAPDLCAKTRSTYGWVWSTYVRPALGDRRLNAISRADLKQLLAAMTAHGAGDPTIEKTASFLSSVFGRAVEDERLHRNPAARLRVARAIRRPPRFLSDEEVFAIVDAADDRVSILILFLAYTGLRIGGAVALVVGDLDLLRRRVTFSRAVTEVDGRRIEKGTKTNGVRTVVMPTFVTDALAHHLEAFSDPRDPDALVFRSATGGPVRTTPRERTSWIGQTLEGLVWLCAGLCANPDRRVRPDMTSVGVGPGDPPLRPQHEQDGVREPGQIELLPVMAVAEVEGSQVLDRYRPFDRHGSLGADVTPIGPPTVVSTQRVARPVRRVFRHFTDSGLVRMQSSPPIARKWTGTEWIRSSMVSVE